MVQPMEKKTIDEGVERRLGFCVRINNPVLTEIDSRAGDAMR